MNPQNDATLLVQRQASHMAVAKFWADFKLSPAHVGPVAAAPTPTKTGVPDTTPKASLTAIPQDVKAQECTSGEAVDSKASAMRVALAAARSEVQAAKHNEPQAALAGPKTKALSNGKKRNAGNAPDQFTQKTGQKPAPSLGCLVAEPLTGGSADVAKQPAAVSASIDLDPATADRLRLMRRLNPAQSDQELMAKIAAEGISPGRAKRRKGWFALK